MIPEPEAKNEVGAALECEELIAELFHQLSQPLTTLTCCLEVCLQKSRGNRKRDLRIALEQAQTITGLTAQLRQLLGFPLLRIIPNRLDLQLVEDFSAWASITKDH
jgi:hypothetical protein